MADRVERSVQLLRSPSFPSADIGEERHERSQGSCWRRARSGDAAAAGGRRAGQFEAHRRATGNWATSVAEVGQRAGIFRKHGLTLDLLYTQGSGETQHAVI